MKNWTVKEAAKVIRENKDVEAIKEIVKHFPLFAVIVAAKDFDGLTDAMPEHMTVRKIENELNNGSAGDADIEEDEDQADEAEDTAEDLENMSTKQLIALCGKRGIKVPKYGKNKQFYLDALNSAGDGDADEAEEEEEEDPVALYKKCKKAGLKVAPKKSAKYYKDQLAKAAQAEEDADDEDDWDDDEEEEKPAKKTAKKAPANKSAKKPAKKAEPEEEEDDGEDEDEDEWDI